MDSLGNLLRLEGFSVNLVWNAKTVTLLDSNAAFVALVSDLAFVDPATQLGEDLRERVAIDARRADVPASLLTANADSQVPCDVAGTRMSIVHREDNPASPIVRFHAVKVI